MRGSGLHAKSIWMARLPWDSLGAQHRLAPIAAAGSAIRTGVPVIHSRIDGQSTIHSSDSMGDPIRLRACTVRS